MATTTNYSWTTPDDTALVKDGAAAIRTLGSSVDTTVKNLNPETTLGDISYRSSTANTNTRLALGTAGQVLTVNSGATAPEWAAPVTGGMTLISTTTLSTAAVTLSSIPQTYNTLYIIVEGMTGNTANSQMRILPNNVNNLYSYVRIYSPVTTTSDEGPGTLSLSGGATTLRTSADNAWVAIIDNYTSSTRFKPSKFYGYFVNASSQNAKVGGFGAYASTTAITSLVLDYGGSNTFAGGTVRLYGVK